MDTITAACVETEKSFFSEPAFTVLLTVTLTFIGIVIPAALSWYWHKINEISEFLRENYPTIDVHRDEAPFSHAIDDIARRLWNIYPVIAYYIFEEAILKFYGQIIFPEVKNKFLKDHFSIRSSRLKLREDWQKSRRL